MESLVGNERAQRVDEQAGLAAGKRAQGGVHLEGERLAAARHHDAEHRLVGIEVVQDELLRVMQLRVADDGAHHFAGKLLRVGARDRLPLDAVALEDVLVFLDGFRVVRGIGAQHVVLRGVQIGHEAQVFRVQARLERGAGARGAERFQHGLHAATVLPFVDLHLERGVDHAFRVHERADVVAVEHDAGHGGAPVGKRAREMVSLGADRTAVQQGDVARQKHGHGMFLPKRRECVELGDVAQRQLVKVDARVDVHERMEGALGQRVHVGAQAPLEFGKLVGGYGHAHGSFVPAIAKQQVGAAFHRLEQVYLADAAPRSARLIAVDGEQQRGHAVGAHQAAGHDALDALVPSFAGHHERALAFVGFGGLHFRYLGKLGLDGATLVVDGLQALGQAARLVIGVGKQQVERQLRIAHAASGV